MWTSPPVLVEPVSFLLAFLFAVLLGVGTGLLTGLSPGLHVNNVAALVLSTRGGWTAFFAFLFPAAAEGDFVPVLLSCYLLAVAVSHGILDFVPSVFFGAPSEETALSVLPGHRMLLEGRGPRAVSLAARGAVLGTAFAAALLFPLRWLLSDPVGLGTWFRPWVPLFLVGILGALLLAEVSFAGRRLRPVARAGLVQALSGLLGLAVLRGPPIVDSTLILFPLFSGLFGMPNLILSLRTLPARRPLQEVEGLPALTLADVVHALRGSFAGASVSWLPGLSGGAAATLASVGSRRRLDASAFMVVLGAVATSTAILSVAVLFILGKARSGTAAAVRDLLGGPSLWTAAEALPQTLLLFVVAAVLASALAAPIASAVARSLATRWSRWDPRKLSAVILAALSLLILLSTGPTGMGVAGLAALVGLVPLALGVRRVHLMASLLVPVFLVYLSA